MTAGVQVRMRRACSGSDPASSLHAGPGGDQSHEPSWVQLVTSGLRSGGIPTQGHPDTTDDVLHTIPPSERYCVYLSVLAEKIKFRTSVMRLSPCSPMCVAPMAV